MNNSFKNALPVVASFYSSNTGVHVRIKGKEAYTDGKSVVVPSVDLSNSEMEPVVWGFLAHECAHIKYTDFDVVQRIKSPLMHSLVNIFEDARIEHEMFKSFPRSAQDIERVINYLISTGDLDYESGIDTLPLITSYLLTMVRATYMGQRALDPIYKAFGEDLDKVDLKLRNDLDELVRVELPKCKNTKDVCDLSQVVLRMIERYTKSSDNSRSFDDNDFNNDEGSGPSQIARDFSSGRTSSIRPSHCSNETNSFGETSEDLKDPLGTDIFSKVKQKISDCSKEAEPEELPSYVGVEDPITGRYPSSLIDELRGTKRECFRRLQDLILAKTENEKRRSCIGRELSIDRLHTIFTDQVSHNFIRYDDEGESVDTSFHIVCDISGSMGRMIANSNPVQRWYEIANASSYSISLALSAIPELEVAVSYFPGNTCNVTAVLKPNQDPELCAENFKQLPRGSTPLDTALWYAAGELSRSLKRRKIMLVITDGLPDDRTKAEYAIKKIEESGIEIYAIGVATESVKELFNHYSILESVIDLKLELFDVVAELLSGAEVDDLDELRCEQNSAEVQKH